MTSVPQAGQRDPGRATPGAREFSAGPASGAPSNQNRQPHRLLDKLVVDQLLVTLRAMYPAAVPQTYIARWWDGVALVPALLVEVEGRRVRVVTGPDGRVLLLPRSSWAARRRLHRARRAVTGNGHVDRPHVAVTPGGLPRTPLVYEVTDKRPRVPRSGRPGPRVPVRVGDAIDYRACSHVGCGAVVALPATGPDPPCPRCGRR